LALPLTVLRLEAMAVAVEGRFLFRDISFDLAPGEHVAIIGPNGIGKTSLLEAIFGLRAKEGVISFCGQTITASSTDAIARLGAVFIPESPPMFSTLTVADNLQIASALARSSGECVFPTWRDALGFFPELRGRERQVAASLSGGEKRMLAVLRAILLDPLLLALDEPFLGLAPAAVWRTTHLLAILSRRGTAILSAHQSIMLPEIQVTRQLAFAGGTLRPG
jgi:branched-chain amino acid transport system ATP-binding protein